MDILENASSSHFLHSLLAVLVLVDVSDHWTRNCLSKEVLQCLSRFPQIPSVLVLNKVSEELVPSAFYNTLCRRLQTVPGIRSNVFSCH